MSATLPQAGGEPAPQGLIKESGTRDFQADVLQASMEVPVLVDFWAPWCGPCKQLTPLLEKVVTGLAGKVRLVKINVDENQALAGQMGVQSIPAVFAFLGGRPVDGFMGAVPESEIRAFTQRLIDAAANMGVAAPPSDREAQIAAALDAGQEALDGGDPERAAEIFALVLRHAPESVPALLGFARAQHLAGNDEGALASLEGVPEADRKAEAYQALKAAIALAGQAEGLEEKETLEARVAADPDDHQARYDLAVVLNARGAKIEAAQALIEIMRRDRAWQDDGARRKLLELFEAWGGKDPATLKGRRLLSSLLFR